MVLSDKWTVSDDQLSGYVAAVERGAAPPASALPKFLDARAGADEAADVSARTTLPATLLRLRSSDPAWTQKPSWRSPMHHHFAKACPQLGLPDTCASSPAETSAGNEAPLSAQPRSVASAEAGAVLRSSAMSTLSGNSSVSTPRRTPRKTHPHELQRILRVDLLQKQDTIACSQSGRRFCGAPSGLIRIYVKLSQAKTCLSLWLDPDLPVHVPRAVGDAALLTPDSSQRSLETEASLARMARWRGSCLQLILEECTGIAPGKQYLRIGNRGGSRRLDLNCGSHVPEGSTLHDCEITHGSEVVLHGLHADDKPCPRRLARANRFSEVRVMPQWSHEHKPNLIGEFHLEETNGSGTVPMFDYTLIPDHGPFDACGGIRHGFRSARNPRSTARF